MKSFFLTCFSVFIFTFCHAGSVIVYPPPVANFSKVSNKFTVSITQNGVTKQSFVYESSAGTGPSSEWGNQINKNFHFTTFSFVGAVTINIVKLNSTASAATIRPNSLSIGTVNTVNQGVNKGVSFTLTKATKVSVEFNDDPSLKDALMIFADTLETAANVPNKAGTNVLQVNSTTNLASIPASQTIMYFNPGVYHVGVWNIPATVRQVYLAGGAYVIGYFNWNAGSTSASTIKINGRGILSNEGYPFHYPSTPADQNSSDWDYAITLTGGQNNLIEGITMIEATSQNIVLHANNALVQNVNINGFRYNNDGIDMIGSGIKIQDCFIRDNDDSITLYANNAVINNCIFWQLQGSEIDLGWKPNSLSNYVISNCTVIHDNALYTDQDCGFIEAMYVSPTIQQSVVNNFTVSNIYFDTAILRFLDIRADRNNTNSALNQGVWQCRNFHFNNIHFNQSTYSHPLVYMHGYDSNHPLVNFTFQNIYFNNSKVTPAKMSDTTFFNLHNAFGTSFK